MRYYIEHERARRPSTVRDYRNALRCYLLPEFGADTLLRTIDTRRIDTYRERLLTQTDLSRRTIQAREHRWAFPCRPVWSIAFSAGCCWS